MLDRVVVDGGDVRDADVIRGDEERSGGNFGLSEPDDPNATISVTPAIAIAARFARKLIRCGGRSCWWRISMTSLSPQRSSAVPNGVATSRFSSSGSVEKRRLVPPMIPSIRTPAR